MYKQSSELLAFDKPPLADPLFPESEELFDGLVSDLYVLDFATDSTWLIHTVRPEKPSRYYVAAMRPDLELTDRQLPAT